MISFILSVAAISAVSSGQFSSVQFSALYYFSNKYCLIGFSVRLSLSNYARSFIGTEHPNPGEPYRGLFCTSYLPNNPAGQEVCNLLSSAFDARLIFTIGKCLATGEENKTVFNGIELKTNRSGGPAK